MSNYGTKDGSKKDDYTSFAKEVDRALKEMEERIYRSFNDRFEAERQNVQNIEKKLSDFKQGSINQTSASLLKERQKVIEATSGSNINAKKMESALNDWLEQVENQVNFI